MSTQYSHKCSFHVSDWGDEHGLIHQLLPLTYRKNDPIQILKQLNAQFDKWPKTKATWVYTEIPADNSSIRGCAEQDLLLPNFTGSYMTTFTNRQTRWTNPRYVHSNNQTVYLRGSRLEHAAKCARIGVYSLSDVAEQFNLTKQSIHKWFQDHESTWGELRSEGRKRLARTLVTIVDWGYYSMRELSKLFPVPRSTLRHWVQEMIPDFEPPDEPMLYR